MPNQLTVWKPKLQPLFHYRKLYNKWIQNLQEPVEKIRISEEVGIRYMNRWEEEMEWEEKGARDKVIDLIERGFLTLDQAAESENMTIEELQALIDRQEETPGE